MLIVSDSKVKPHVANTVKAVIMDGIKKGKIDPKFQLEFSNEVRHQNREKLSHLFVERRLIKSFHVKTTA